MTSYFQQHGIYLAQKVKAGIEANDLVFMRQWLDDAPLQKDPVDMHSWGMILHHLLEYQQGHPIVSPKDGDHVRLGAYFEATAGLSAERWWEKGPNVLHMHSISGMAVSSPSYPAYDALCMVCSTLERSGLSHVQPHLGLLVKEGLWEPDDLLGVLDRMRGHQIGYMGKTNDFGTMSITAQGKLLRALRPLVLDTEWRPKNVDVYGDVWEVHDYRVYDNQWDSALREKKFAQQWLKSVPSQNHKALAFVGEALDLMTHELDLDNLFPMDLRTCDPLKALKAALLIMAASEGADILKKHHPALVELLQMHSSLSDGPGSDDPMLEALVPSFSRAYQGGSALGAAMPVDATVFGHDFKN